MDDDRWIVADAYRTPQPHFYTNCFAFFTYRTSYWFPTRDDNVNGKLSLNDYGPVTHKCVSKVNIIVSGYGLSPGQGQIIIWTNAG